MNTVTIIVKVDAFPSGSAVIMDDIEEAITNTGIKVVYACVGKQYGFCMWEALFKISKSVHTEENRQRVLGALQGVYIQNNPHGELHGENVIRGMMLEWNPEEHDDAN